MASRGMGAMRASKMPKGVRKERRDDTDFTEYADGGPVGLYANINAKRKRIAAGSKEKMRKPGSKVRLQLKHSLTLLRLLRNDHYRNHSLQHGVH